MRKTSAILLAAALPMAVQAANTEFTHGGFIKFDAMYSQYSDGDLGAASTGRDFYVPGTIPTGADKTSSTHLTAPASRFDINAVTTLDNDEKVTGFVELDFLTHNDGTENNSTSYSPRLRHAFFTYNALTRG